MGKITRNELSPVLTAELDAHYNKSASLEEGGHVQLSSDTDSDDETKAATPKAVKTAYDLAQSAFQSASNGKQLISSAVTGKGVEISPGATFEEMANAIKQINTGKQWARGNFTITSKEQANIINLSFDPGHIIVRWKDSAYTSSDSGLTWRQIVYSDLLSSVDAFVASRGHNAWMVANSNGGLSTGMRTNMIVKNGNSFTLNTVVNYLFNNFCEWIAFEY